MRNCSNRNLEKVRCPFFRSHNASEICCEGLPLSSGLRLVFDCKGHLERHERTFCWENFEHCRLHQAIMEQYKE